MPNELDAAYCERREREEIAASRAAVCPSARAAHRELAEAYGRLATGAGNDFALHGSLSNSINRH